MKKEASVVIRCNNDERVFQCISSIDADVEIVVVMNENPDLQQRLEKLGVTCCMSPPGNLSIVSNIGFDAATSDKVIITDSDTTFGKNCIHELIKGLDTYNVVRAPLRFPINSHPFSREISAARDYVNSLPVVYTPGIGVTKRLPGLIRGFLFDNAIPFAVDANLSYRVYKERIPVLFLRDAWIVHSAEDLRHDLHAAQRIGAGNKKSVENLHALYPTERKRDIKKRLKGVKLRQYPDVLLTRGARVLGYQILWDIHYYAGFYFS